MKKYIFGIGNPGKRYDKTRHNIGFMVVDELKKLGLKDAALVKPDTFVNQTGKAVREIIESRKPELKDVLVVCDDVNLGFGKLRLRPSGSAGGHHGLESIIASLQDDGFARLRVGVGNETMPADLECFVLEPFNEAEKKEVGQVIERAAAICQAWAKEGFTAAQNQLSRSSNR
ncbi:MAG: peptidyl-tRNA hydrolase [Candidatus Omnitrophica bacterium]|nr:peptidyl-tRNA hydrolase [Candidatus Omnitrophota bacterium]